MSKILERAENAMEIEVNPQTYLLRVYLAGDSGSGKTQAMASMPGRKLFIDFDNRIETVVGTPDTYIVRCHEADPRSPKAWQQLLTIQKDIVADIKADNFPFESIIYDGLTMMGRISMNWALLLDPKRGLGGSPAQQHYLPQMDNLSKFILRTLTLPRHIGYTGHVELHEDLDDGKMKFYPKITGKLRTELPNWFNETYYCFRVKDSKGKTSYRWNTAGSGQAEFFKSSLNQLGKYWDDPIVIDFSKTPVGFEDLLERRFGDAWKNRGSGVAIQETVSHEGNSKGDGKED